MGRGLNPGGGNEFSLKSVHTGSGAQPTSSNVYRVLFLGVRRPRSDVEHYPPLSNAEVRTEYSYLYSPSVPHGMVEGELYILYVAQIECKHSVRGSSSE
jgi:hypothetical protein